MREEKGEEEEWERVERGVKRKKGKRKGEE